MDWEEEEHIFVPPANDCAILNVDNLKCCLYYTQLMQFGWHSASKCACVCVCVCVVSVVTIVSFLLQQMLFASDSNLTYHRSNWKNLMKTKETFLVFMLPGSLFNRAEHFSKSGSVFILVCALVCFSFGFHFGLWLMTIVWYYEPWQKKAYDICYIAKWI